MTVVITIQVINAGLYFFEGKFYVFIKTAQISIDLMTGRLDTRLNFLKI